MDSICVTVLQKSECTLGNSYRRKANRLLDTTQVHLLNCCTLVLMEIPTTLILQT